MPITIELRRTGATIISRRKPNSRSQTSEAALKTAVNITDMQRMPGKMNVVRSTSPPTTESRPAPSANRNSIGWISDVTIRIRSCLNRINSRLQTILIARSSLRYVRSGTRTRTTAVLIAALP